jgi:geranyl-CoA carboxylase beta subunit
MFRWVGPISTIRLKSLSMGPHLCQHGAQVGTIPPIAVVHGSSTAGGAHHPCLSHCVTVVKRRSKIFLAGPPFLKAAAGEIAREKDLGGAEMYSSISGVAEYLAEDMPMRSTSSRQIMATLPGNQRLPPIRRGSSKDRRYSSDELCGAVPVDCRKSDDAHAVIARLVDDSDYGTSHSSPGANDPGR